MLATFNTEQLLSKTDIYFKFYSVAEFFPFYEKQFSSGVQNFVEQQFFMTLLKDSFFFFVVVVFLATHVNF